MVNKIKNIFSKPPKKEELNQGITFKYKVVAERKENVGFYDGVIVTLKIRSEDRSISFEEEICEGYIGYDYITGDVSNHPLNKLEKMTKGEWEELAMKKIKKHLAKIRGEEEVNKTVKILLNKLNSQSGTFVMEVE